MIPLRTINHQYHRSIVFDRVEKIIFIQCVNKINKIFEGIIVNIFLSISVNICFGCSKEPSHRDGSFEYPQHMFWLRNKKNDFLLCTLNPYKPSILIVGHRQTVQTKMRRRV